MTLPVLPAENADPWYETRNTFDLAVKSDLEGRLSDAQLSGKYGTTSGARPVAKGELVINVKDYGALGNNTADDTAAFQAGIDAAYTARLPLFVPPGYYKVLGTLKLPQALQIIGTSRLTHGWATADYDIRNCRIDTFASPVFDRKDTASVQNVGLLMEGIEFFNQKAAPAATCFPSTIKLVGSDISKCAFLNYGVVFACEVSGLTRIHRNTFMQIQGQFMTGALVDAWIGPHNYISGHTSYNATAFALAAGSAAAAIHDNFIEFFKFGFNYLAGGGLMIHGNIFDYCYRAIQGGVTLGGWQISDNLFMHCNQAGGSGYFPNADAPMLVAGSWIAIHAENGIVRSTVTGNRFIICDAGQRVRNYPVHRFNSRDNVYDTVTTEMDYNPFFGGTGGEGEQIQIQEIDLKTVTTLPPAVINSGFLVSYHGQRVIYQNKVVTNINGTWRDGVGTAVT